MHLLWLWSVKGLWDRIVSENASKDKEVKLWVYCETVSKRLLVILYKLVSYLSRFYCHFGGVSLSSARCKGQVTGLTVNTQCFGHFLNGFEHSLTRHM